MKLEETYIYFMLNPKTGEIKIGHSKDPVARRKALSRELDSELILLDTHRDWKDNEKWFHNYYGKLRTHGEWFRAEGELLDLVNGVAAKRHLKLARFEPLGSGPRKSFWESLSLLDKLKLFIGSIGLLVGIVPPD